MGEVSNKTLATLLVVAIVVSLGGTFISLNRLSSIAKVSSITGFATGTGKVNVTIVESTTISTPDDNIWFGEGNVDDNELFADLWSNGTKINWTNSTPYLPVPSTAGAGIADFIVIQNDGNIDLNITVYTTQNSSEYLCNGDVASLTGPAFTECELYANYTYWTVDNETAAGDSCVKTFGNSTVPIPFIGNGSQPRQEICGQLRAAELRDTVRVYSYLRVGSTVTGALHDTLNFVSAASTDQG
ncbi:hypothetical protein ACFLZ6_02020 [Nanoarchaeota archaeon]